MTKSQAPAINHARKLNRFSIQGANIYDHLDQADVLIRVDGDWESEDDRDQYVNALAARLQAPAVVAQSNHQSIATALREQGERERTYELQDAFNRAAQIVERMGK